MAGYRLTEGSKGRYYPAILAIISLLIISYCLSNFDMNVKAVIATGANKTGIWIGLFGSILLILSLIWSGVRVLNLNNTMHEVMLETAKTTSLVFIILLGAAVLTAAFRAFGGEELVRNFLNSMPGGFWAKFVIVMAVIFILGFFLDFIEIAVVVVPIVAPILLADPAANITAVWLGVMIGLNIQTSFLTPPFGFALFYLRGVAPIAVKTVSNDNYSLLQGGDDGVHLVSAFSKDEKMPKVGDLVVTSGSAQIFPSNILVGKIVEVRNDNFVVLPFVDFKNIDYVQVVENK